MKENKRYWDIAPRYTIKEIKSLSKEELISYLHILSTENELIGNEKILHKNTFLAPKEHLNYTYVNVLTYLKKSQIQELPNKYQLLLGYKDGKNILVQKLDSGSTDSVINAKKSKSSIAESEWFWTAFSWLIYLSPLILLTMCIAMPKEDCTTITYQDFDSNYNVVTKKGRVCGEAQSQVHDRWKD